MVLVSYPERVIQWVNCWLEMGIENGLSLTTRLFYDFVYF